MTGSEKMKKTYYTNNKNIEVSASIYWSAATNEERPSSRK